MFACTLHFSFSSPIQQTVTGTVEEMTLPVANGNSLPSAPNAPSKTVSSLPSSSSSSTSSNQPVPSTVKKEKEKNAEKNYEKKGYVLIICTDRVRDARLRQLFIFLSIRCSSFHDFHEAMDASQLLKEKERDKDKEKERERKSKLNNSAQILNSNNSTNSAHIKQRNNIHSNSSNETGNSSGPNEHVLRLEADIKRLKADLQVTPFLRCTKFST